MIGFPYSALGRKERLLMISLYCSVKCSDQIWLDTKKLGSENALWTWETHACGRKATTESDSVLESQSSLIAWSKLHSCTCPNPCAHARIYTCPRL